ncbi:MAG: hypothetical protein KGJ00_09140 [Bradyrhizobium sp.]|nr:hypothetical protein [Bradyrhizobium sp.]
MPSTANLRREARLSVNKVNWKQVGHVNEPGRYMFRFGWLTIRPEDLAIWTQFPDASFTLVQTAAPPLAAGNDDPTVETEEFHLGAFELHVAPEPGLQDVQNIRLSDELAPRVQSSV